MGEFRELLKRNKIPSSKTIAGQAQSNSMVERSNGSLKRLLSKYKAMPGSTISLHPLFAFASLASIINSGISICSNYVAYWSSF